SRSAKYSEDLVQLRTPITGAWHAIVARLLVAVLLLLSAGPLLHAADGHEGDFGPIVAHHDCTQHDHELAAPGQTVLLDVHCAVCHFGRHARQVAGLGAGVFLLFVASGRLAHEPVRVPRAAAVLP